MKSELYRTQTGVEYRDLNKNGHMDPYEDPRIPVEERINDLLSQMTLEEKAGMLFIDGAAVNADGSIEDKPDEPGFARAAVTQITDQKMSHFNLWQIPGAQVVAAWQAVKKYNRLISGKRCSIVQKL